MTVRKAVLRINVSSTRCASNSRLIFSSKNIGTAGRNSMKRSETFPRLNHLTSACIAKSENVVTVKLFHQRMKLFMFQCVCHNKICCFGYGIHGHFELSTSQFAAQLFLVQNTMIWVEFWHIGSFLSKSMTAFSFPAMDGVPSVVIETEF